MSTMVESRTQTTPGDLLAMPDGKNYELVDGVLVERNMSALSSLVASKLNRLIGNFCESNASGWVFGADCGYQCFPGFPKKVHRPDVSFIRQSRMTVAQLAEGFIPIAPDLAVEVVSPNDLVYKLAEKIQEYLDAGVPLIWIIYPSTRSVYVHRRDGTITLVRAGQDLDGEGVLPGFRCRVADLFPTTAPAVLGEPERPG
ncbi:MAG: Uma2 family endonuclease [Isosphaeraceae bacterium]